MTTRRVAIILLALVLMLMAPTAGCVHVMGEDQRPDPVSFVVGVDLSLSPTKNARTDWLALGTREIIDRLRIGDALRILPIHDNTSSAAAVFEGETRLVDSADAQIVEHGRLRVLKEQARDALKGLLQSETRARSTDVLSAFDRVPPDAGRRVIVVLLSDMVQSTRALDFERPPLTLERIPGTLASVMAAHTWTDATLARADVYIALDGIGSGDHAPRVDRRTLCTFYEQLVARLGGRLVSFDTALRIARQAPPR